MTADPILVAGQTCWRVVKADRFAYIVDGADYLRHVKAAMLRAQHQIILVGWDFDLTVLAAVLAVIGYSLNDSIVVADRIRENLRGMRGYSPVDIVNISLTDTLGRTLVTSGTTLMVLVALALVGGEMIHSFALALLVGGGVGTYSSVFIVASLLVAMKISPEDLVVPEKEGAELDELP